ncbi:MAG: hypothetical protein ACRC3H_24380 [Lachnospiraceae bacterium]
MAKCDKAGKLLAKKEQTTEQARWHFRRKPYSSIDVSEYIKRLKEGVKHGQRADKGRE